MAESIFTSQTPLAGNVNDGTQYTLGTVFTPAVNGTVTHIRVFAPASAPASPFVGVLYSITGEGTGTELARATFGALTPSDWNTVELPGGGVDVTAGQYYVATYITPDFFVLTTLFFTSSGVTNGNLTAPQSGDPFGNGRLHVGDGFPEVASGQQTNYFADVVFDVAVTGTPVTGVAELDLPPLEVDLGGDVSVTGTATITLPTLSAAVTGNVSADGELDILLPTLSVAATGDVGADGALTVLLPTLSAAVTGEVSSAGELDVTLPTLSFAATGTVAVDVEGDLESTLPDLEVSLDGETQVIDIFSYTFAVVTGVGECAVAELARTEAGMPKRVCLAVPGDIAWDNCHCGQFVQSISTEVPSENFPFPATDRRSTACGPAFLVVTVTASIQRCVETFDRNGKVVDCDVLFAAARRLEDDRTALRYGITCCLRELRRTNRITDYAVGAATAVGPNGGCVGVDLTYQFAVSNTCCG